MSAELWQLPCVICEEPMRGIAGPRITWEGDYEFHAFRFECRNACQTSAEVSYRTFIPVDVARLRP